MGVTTAATYAFGLERDPLLSAAHGMADMPHGTDCPYPIRILAFFEMIRPYHVGIRISGNLWGKHCNSM